ncbi:MAG: phosphoribosylformylglycinamidine synthase subunit PurQ [Collinsella sp.]
MGEDSKPSMDLSVNPNGSALAIEGITSPDGRVLGKMAMPSVAATTCTATCPSMSPAISSCRSLRAA